MIRFDTNITTEKIFSTIRQAYTVKDVMYLRFGDCCIRVFFNRAEIGEYLSNYFGSFVVKKTECELEITVHEGKSPAFASEFTIKQPDPGKTKIKEEYLNLQSGRIVRKRLTGMVFVFGEGENLAVGPCLENLNQVVNFINNRYIEWELCRGSLLGHAAAVTHKGQGIAIAGFSGAGKSTLSLHLMSKGTHFVSNDRLMVNLENRELLMRGVAKLPRINPGTILNNRDLIEILTEAEKEEFSSMEIEELWQLEHKFDVPIEQCFNGSKFLLKAPMKVLAILNWKRDDGPTKFKEVDLNFRQDLLPAFMKSTGLFFLPYMNIETTQATEENYIAMLQYCKVIEFSGSVDFEKATEVCLSAIEHGSLEHVAAN